jgi:hypothetical protein
MLYAAYAERALFSLITRDLYGRRAARDAAAHARSMRAPERATR